MKWNQINLISMESVLGSNCRIPLLHMSKRKKFIEVTNERINEFSFAYMCNPHLHINKMFTDHVKICLSRTFGSDTVKQINAILKKRNTRVLALIMIYELGDFSTIKVFKVLSCVLYTMIEKICVY